MALIGAQIRAARAALDITASDLAHRAGVSGSTLQRMEASAGVPPVMAGTLDSVRRALEAAGVSFHDSTGFDEKGVTYTIGISLTTREPGGITSLTVKMDNRMKSQERP